MSTGDDVSMADSKDVKLDTVLSALEALTTKTELLAKQNQELYMAMNGGHERQPLQQVIPPKPAVQEGAVVPSQTGGPSTSTKLELKEPRISLPEKFDGTRSKFRGFVNQVRLVFILQPQRYPTDVSRVGLVGTLLSGQALSWFAPLFEKQSPILNSFDVFLVAFEEAFGEHDKIRSATTKIRVLRQGMRSASVYASDFRQLACDINWDDQALISQFQWGLRDDVKDLLLTMPDPTNLNEAISQAVRCDNRLFQRRQDKRFLPTPRQHNNYSMAVTSPNSNVPSEVEDMQIDAARFKPLTEEEKRRRRMEHLCLYCGKPNHKIDNCLEKKRRSYKMRSATTLNEARSENEDVQPH